ncbi:tRNA dihydrouridine synthase DusB [Moraxella nonliquefaciens]|uniref:tRNA-dihydrouridine synthase B n=1 Tax=Moraxella nonliquefaciens TaxID=478 RepID=A0A1B8QIY9_MORNO|nr:tRNA dihydrouridine synthase DusB [Moraxella nonliquefaciens]OBX49176.1 tRNA-dihydrouridine synthase B [Moraxella nonliquefaciens]OBX83423.1 tRNA-dihydrouridine synthase B [Moraxella nonliquefaciens]QPT43937.1 tRNA dihydrouridine synthase DusB [Moraxella nonliquefaciens]QQC28957.1 tRNA dihydrouridine synthase DusB [Moraxella nonliquefaciens]
MNKHILLTPLTIGNQTINNRLIVAPMAGVTDNPFRRLAKSFGAGHAISEMIIADTALYARQKSLYRANFTGEIAPISAQVAGAEPDKLAQAVRFQVENGACIVDINMGCPTKKVCRKLSGSALLQDLDLVKKLLDSAVESVANLGVPITLKTRLGFANGQENILTVAKIAENAGISALAIHGRTREDFYTGNARYELIKTVKETTNMPIIVNGDIDTPQKAKWVQEYTGADAVMIGRAGQGRPWIFREIAHYLATGEMLAPPTLGELREIVLNHLDELYQFYGEYSGCRIARKHIAWYTGGLTNANAFREAMYHEETTCGQYKVVDEFFKTTQMSK